MQAARARVRRNGADDPWRPRAVGEKRPVPCEEMRKKPAIVIVNDKIQSGYTYVLTEPTGRNFNPEFRPELTPKKCCAWAYSAAST